MCFAWDEAKNRSNLIKHGISFETARLVFEDPHALSDQDRVVGGEERWQTIGQVGAQVLLAAHTWSQSGVIRLISARKASSAERRHYETHKKAS